MSLMFQSDCSGDYAKMQQGFCGYTNGDAAEESFLAVWNTLKPVDLLLQL